jgi:hypothetical protein
MHHRGKTQNFSSFLAYLPESLRAQLRAAKEDYAIAITLAGFLGKLGLRKPGESTILNVTAFVLATSVADHTTDTPDDLHKMYIAMKQLVRTVLKEAIEPFIQTRLGRRTAFPTI